jgi:class 3 adenylate cyclase
MATTTATRRLAAIFAADVVGYSRLMGADEEGTHERFKAHLVELLDPKIREHHGRIVKTTGDGVLAEFASVVAAVRCAGEIQRAMADRDLDLAEEHRLRFRIGLNLGDMIADGDIYGEGVSIAVRLEGLAAPGGICVSGTVRGHIGDRLPYAFDDTGEQSVKNIARPVRVYSLRQEGIAGLPAAGASSSTSSLPPLAAPRLSIVVLPFTNLRACPKSPGRRTCSNQGPFSELARYLPFSRGGGKGSNCPAGDLHGAGPRAATSDKLQPIGGPLR